MANTYRRAQDIIERRRETAEKEAELHREEIEAVSPELKSLNQAISSAGLRAVKAIGAGENAQEEIRKLAKENLDNQRMRRQILKNLGVPEDYLEVHYTCTKCNDTGVYQGHYCDCFKALVKQLQTDSLNAVAPARYSTFGSFDLEYYKGITAEDGTSAYDTMEQILQYCKAYAEDFSRQSPNVLMSGRTGLGKTHLSLAIANVVLGKGYQVIYGSAHNLLNQIEGEHFGRSKLDYSVEETVLDCDLLILDDLGAEFSTSFTRAEIYNILNTRILKGLPTIISTNLNIDELAQTYTERVASRIIGNYTPLEFAGRDVRQLKS